MTKTTLILFSFLFFISCGRKPTEPIVPIYTKVLPGSDALNAGIIKPHKVSYEKIGGSMIYILERVFLDSAEVYKASVYLNDDESGTPDIMYFDVNTLGYVGRKLVLPDYTIDVAFSQGRFKGDLIPTEGSKYKPVKYDKAYDHGAFEPAIINYFISALPLKEGYTASIPILDLNNGSEILWANIEVEGKEILIINGQQTETWKVLSHGIREKTIWVSTTEPYFIKMKTEGNWGTWELDKVF
jgi:hypothetical protein